MYYFLHLLFFSLRVVQKVPSPVRRSPSARFHVNAALITDLMRYPASSPSDPNQTRPRRVPNNRCMLGQAKIPRANLLAAEPGV